MKKIRILHLTTDSKIGGTERMLLTLADMFDRNKFEMEFAVLLGGGELITELEKRGIKVHNLNMKSKCDLNIIFKLYKLIKNNYDILHTYLFHSHQIGRVLGWAAGIPVIIGGHRSPDNWKKWYHKFVNSCTSRLADLLIANSEFTRNSLIEREKINGKKIIVINNGIDLSESLTVEEKEKIKIELNIPSDKRIVGIVANLTVVKDYYSFIDICSELNKIRKDVYFISIGKGPLKNNIEKYADEKNVRNISFLGYRGDVIRILNIFDVFVLTSLWESSPRSVLESMSAGIPVAAPDVGGIPELVENGKTGFLYAAKDIPCAVDKINLLLNDKELYLEFQKNSRKKVEEEFSINQFIKKTEEVYLSQYNKKIELTPDISSG